MVREQLLRLFPRHAVRHALIDEGLDHRSSSVCLVARIDAYHPPPPGGLVLVLGDLGVGTRGCRGERELGAVGAMLG